MDQQTVIADIERRAQNINRTVGEVCRMAKVHPTSFSRWKKTERNPEPKGANYASFEKIWAVLASEEQRLAALASVAVEAQAA